MNDANHPIHQGSGNVFADLGFDKEEAANLLVRARLMSRLIDYIEAEGLTQEKAALRLGIHQPRVSMLMRGKIEAFSIDALGKLELEGGETLSTAPTLNATSTVEYNDTTANRNLKDWTYGHLTINATGRTVTMGVSETMLGDLNITDGTLETAGFTVEVDGTLTIGATGIINATSTNIDINADAINSNAAGTIKTTTSGTIDIDIGACSIDDTCGTDGECSIDSYSESSGFKGTVCDIKIACHGFTNTHGNLSAVSINS